MFHLAIYVPTRSAAVAVVARAEAARWPHAEIDHIVSESVYLSDPDGNGIEIAYPTPSRGILNPAFPRASDKMFMDPDSGSELDGSSPLDYSSELRDLAREQFDAMLAPESVLGHIHLKVEDIQATAAFYAELPGFKVNVLWERAGYVDLTVGGSVLHTVAGNTWSAPYTHKAKGAAGLRSFSLVVSGDSELEQAAAALRARDHGFSMQGGRIETHDPSGNLLQIIAP
jgi:catechol 2,3-dioxygenase